MVALGVLLRLLHIAHPGSLTFDENHFVNNARNYLSGKADYNDHPPLGKLLIAVGIKLFGDNSLGWRAAPTFFGILSILLAWQLARAAFGDRRTGWIAAALIAGDGFFIAYSRTALLDGMLTSLVLATAVLTLRARREWHILVACVSAGLAVGIKVSAAVLMAPILLVTLAMSQAPRVSALYVAVVPAVYYLSYAAGFAIIHAPYGPMDVWRATMGMMNHHLGETQMTNPLTSRFYTWLIPIKPITMRSEVGSNGMMRVMSSLGNPLLWWSSSLAMVAASARLAWNGLRSVRPDVPEIPRARSFLRLHGPAIAMLAVYWLAFIAPWVLSRRDSYVYHYLPSYGFAIVLVAGLLGHAYARWRRPALAAVLVLCLVAVFYAPVAAQLPLSPDALYARIGWWP